MGHACGPHGPRGLRASRLQFQSDQRVAIECQESELVAKGDQVEAKYTQALAIAVEPAAKK